MILGIDATNIRAGGGLTHLREILINADPAKHGISKVVVWSSAETLLKLPEYQWLEKRTNAWLNRSFIFSFVYQILFLSRQARNANCDLLFAPGGTFLGNFKNLVSMSQNMLPFENVERGRFPDLKSRIRFRLLNITQSATFRKSIGVIFLTRYAQQYILKTKSIKTNSVIIPHGINLSFLQTPKVQLDINNFTLDSPFRLLYVSIVTAYKHQWNVAEAVLKLRQEGFYITLDLIGGYTSESFNRLQRVLDRDIDNCVIYHGPVEHSELGEAYKNADAFVFASSCENMPIILIEAMTAGLPIASSNMGPMPEILGDAGFYFNPTQTHDIYRAIKEMIESQHRREVMTNLSYNKSIDYTWKECSDNTFAYLSQIAKSLIHENPK